MNKQYERALNEIGNKDLIKEWATVSMDTFGYLTDRYPRYYEYTWILTQLKGTTGNILDIGAGMSPLPVILCRTAKVVTIDYMEEVGNEWGFIDYSQYGNCESHNVDIAKFKTRKRFNAVYSVSALEHMPKETYTTAIIRSAQYLNKGGRFLATVDLIKNTDKLWHKSYGQVIEDDHGDIDYLVEMLERHFSRVNFWTRRGIQGVGQDLLYIDSIK